MSNMILKIIAILVISFPIWISGMEYIFRFISNYVIFRNSYCGKQGHSWEKHSNVFTGFDSTAYREWETCSKCKKTKTITFELLDTE